MGIYSYKITRDYGFAPNPFHGFCTLATCKPGIRRMAKLGSLVFGCGSAENKRVGDLICAFRVSEIRTFQEYWDDPRFAIKRPNFHASPGHAFGDNIYHRGSRGRWIQEKSHHSFKDGKLNKANLDTDTSSTDRVLVAQEFVYFGKDSIKIPARLRNFRGEDLYPNVRDYRCNYSPSFIAAVERWFSGLPRGLIGLPIKWK